METINTKPQVIDAAELLQEFEINDGRTNENFIDIIDGMYYLAHIEL